MGLHKLTAGDGYTYLTRQVAVHDATERGSRSLGDYYSERGESPGAWMGSGLAGLEISPGEPVAEEQMRSLFGLGRHPNADRLAVTGDPAGGALGKPFRVCEGSAPFQVEVARRFSTYNKEHDRAWNAPIPAEDRARIRTAVATEMFADLHGRAPLDDREIAGFVATASRQRTTAVAGYDLTFSPVKSVSTLWALAPPEVASVVRSAHDAAVADTLSWLEREVGFTRLGAGGVRQVPVTGLVAAAFTHRDSRAGDPDLHTHLAVSNKVQTDQGRWLALDARVLYKAKVAASERYNTRLEAELADRLGVRFADRARTTSGQRPVREIVGINPWLIRAWSSRRAAIEARRSQLASQFQATHGRPPTAVEALALAQTATLQTRDGKHEPRSEAEQRAAWRAEAIDVLGSEAELRHMLRDALEPTTPSIQRCDDWTEVAAPAVVAELEQRRATWQIWHVRAEAERRVRAAAIPLGEHDAVVEELVGRVLDGLSVRLGIPDPVDEPPQLRRPDHTSVYDVQGATTYTSARVLRAEQRLLEIAGQTDGRRISEVRVGIAVAEEAANGIDLNDAQQTMVRDLVTSGRRLQLGLAPAGTGKTTTMRVLSRAWSDSGGYVLGLAPSAQAAHELGTAIDGRTETLAKLTWTLAHEPREAWPGWVSRIGPRTLVIIDEAGQAGTADLAAAVEYVTGRGGSVRLIGDDQQLAAIAAGGVLRDLQHSVGAATLSEVRRFADPAEAAVTLAVREGNQAALGFYADHERIHVGDLGSVTDAAYRAWAEDRAAGRDAILLAPTRDLVTALNARARADLPHRPGPEVALADGTSASPGDVIITRRNQRRLPVSATDWVKNGDRWTVVSSTPDGRLTVRGLTHHRTVTLPADYVAEHVQLGYACTVHGAQGMTTDTAHVVLNGEETRQVLYVALSRGRCANHLYLSSGYDGDPHSLVRRDVLLPPSALDTLTEILQRDGSQTSASTAQRELTSPAVQLHDAAHRYRDALDVAATDLLPPSSLEELDRQVEALWPGLTSEPAYPTLRGHLALHALDGADPLAALIDVAGDDPAPGSNGARDRAAVLDWRLASDTEAERPLPWLAGIPARLRAHPTWGPYLAARSRRVTDLTRQVRLHALACSPGGMPAWAASTALRSDHELRADLAVWRAALGVTPDDSRPTGPRQPAAEAAAHQRHLRQRLRTAGLTPTPAQLNQWADRLPASFSGDLATRNLCRRLDALQGAGLDVDRLLHNALTRARPLPDEHPADALWWRIVGHLGPAALRADSPQATTLRPDWTPLLAALFGSDVAERVIADTAWPALVAAVHARPTGWSAEGLLTAATSRSQIPADELCQALVWRIATLTDEPTDPEEPEPHPTTAPPTPNRPALAQPRKRGTSKTRIHELNQTACDYYCELYPRSWAPGYVQTRLGTDLTGNGRFPIGYAPPGPTSLVRHLTGAGATEAELLDAGLARRTDDGALIDTFRDRLIFPIQHHDDRNEVVGFIGRRNPTKDTRAQHGRVGPKYLNTKTTAAFTKGDHLYGLAEGRAALRRGAKPVLVEGPMDALAVTLAGGGQYVGIAPLGTALTTRQVDALKSYVASDPSAIIVATDPDAAGWLSAKRAYWMLTTRGADPQHLALPDRLDPADLLRTNGTPALGRALDQSGPLADAILDQLIDSHRQHPESPAARLRLVREAAQVIGALPPVQWAGHIDRVQDLTGLPAGMLHLEVLDTGQAWTNDPAANAAAHLSELAARQRHAAQGTYRATTRWAAQAESASPGITATPDWPRIQDLLTRAHADGHDVPALLALTLTRADCQRGSEPARTARSVVVALAVTVDPEASQRPRTSAPAPSPTPHRTVGPPPAPTTTPRGPSR